MWVATWPDSPSESLQSRLSANAVYIVSYSSPRAFVTIYSHYFSLPPSHPLISLSFSFDVRVREHGYCTLRRWYRVNMLARRSTRMWMNSGVSILGGGEGGGKEEVPREDCKWLFDSNVCYVDDGVRVRSIKCEGILPLCGNRRTFVCLLFECEWIWDCTNVNNLIMVLCTSRGLCRINFLV